MSSMDAVLGFTVGGRHARGRVARIGPVLEQVLSAHGYPPVIERLLAEALVIAALLGSTLKDGAGQMTLQAQTEGGIVELMVCDYRSGELRGYVKHDAARLGALPLSPSLQDLFGKGYLAITFDREAGQRYQGIVPLEGSCLAEAVEHYFCQSEQIPSLVRTGLSGEVAGGILLQHLPEGEEGRERLHTRLDHPEWEHVAALGATVSADELVDPGLALEDIVWRLFHDEEDVRTTAPEPLVKGCRCDADHVRSVIMRFPEGERAAMVGDDGTIAVDCAFCSRVFPISL
jgi:molecular chaperone Hsp33